MLSLKGIYQNGQIQLEKPLTSDRPMKIIVTFLEEPPIQENVSEKTSLQEAFSELRIVCAEEQCELIIPPRHSRIIEF
jgi:hypothetical protein